MTTTAPEAGTPDAPDAPDTTDALDEPGAVRWFLWGLVAIVVVGLVIRVVYIMTARQGFFDDFKVGGDPFKLGDAYLYQRGAVLLAEGKGFVNPYQYDLFGIRQEDASHVPLFMLWLWIPAVLGFTGAQAAALWSAVLGGGTIILVGFAGREMAGPRVGLIAAVFAAVYPNVFSHDGFLQSETMAIFTVTLTVWLAYRYWH
ncbi:MAG: glycosyl transferase, partial [Actinomycetota bacterium]